MPHIILQGPVDLKKFFSEFEPLSQKSSGEILKMQTAFMSREGDMVLIDALAVEDGNANRFFVQIFTKEGRTTVKIYPWPDPEKTPGVKKIIALAAQMLMKTGPGITCGATNLKEFLL